MPNELKAVQEILTRIAEGNGNRLTAGEALMILRVIEERGEATQADYEEVLDDHRRLCRELDAALSFPDEPARQASLCDLIPFAKSVATNARRYLWLRGTSMWPEEILHPACLGDAMDAAVDKAIEQERGISPQEGK